MRTSTEQIEREAIEDLIRTLASLGYQSRSPVPSADSGVDLIVDAAGRRLLVEVKARAVASSLPPEWLEPSSRADVLVVVADVVTETARRQLREAEAGWFDRRGHLHLPPHDDFDVESCPRRSAQVGEPDPMGGRAALEVALAALTRPHDPPGVRELARDVGMAPSSISAARSTLIDALLLTPDGRPVRPHLFAAVAVRWTPDWHPAASDPAGGLHGVDMVIGGDVGAVINGAPMVIGSAAPTHYYVRDSRDRYEALSILGRGSVLEPGCWLGVAPARVIMSAAEEDGSMRASWIAGRVVPPVVSALELATDPARGREVLDDWDLPEAPWRT